jgi:tetratricopeptide (TPR) repeat protein
MNDVEKSISNARELYDSGKFEEASRVYLEGLKQTKSIEQSALIWAELCWTFYKMEKFEQAIDAAENVLSFDVQYAMREDIYRLMGFSYSYLGNDDKSREFLKKSIEIDNESKKQKYIYYELGKLEFRNQNYQESQKYLNEVEEYFKENDQDYWLSLLFFKGFNFYYQQNIDEGEKTFKLLVEKAKDPISQSNGYYGLAYITFEKKDYLETVNISEKVTKLNPNFFDMESLGFLMAASFFSLGRYDVFKLYFEQMKKSYTSGRYFDELSKMYKQIPKTGETPQAN